MSGLDAAERLVERFSAVSDWSPVARAWMARAKVDDETERAAEARALEAAAAAGILDELLEVAEAASDAAVRAWSVHRTTPFAGSEAKGAVSASAYQAAIAIAALAAGSDDYALLLGPVATVAPDLLNPGA